MIRVDVDGIRLEFAGRTTAREVMSVSGITDPNLYDLLLLQGTERPRLVAGDFLPVDGAEFITARKATN